MRFPSWHDWRIGLATACAVQILLGCAFMNRDNRRLLSKLDEAVQPKSAAARVVLAPAAIPAASIALAADAVVIHPLTVIPKSWDDVYELYWKNPEEQWLRAAVFFGPKVALTPPTFVGDWALRSLLNIK